MAQAAEEVIAADFDRCFVCARPNQHLRKKTVVKGRYRITSRLCGENLDKPCPPLTPMERMDPRIRHYWTRLPKDVEDLDAGIREHVLKLRELGLDTMFSCDGHNTAPAYIDFLDKPHVDRALQYFEKVSPFVRERSHAILGTIYRLLLPLGQVAGSLKRPRGST